MTPLQRALALVAHHGWATGAELVLFGVPRAVVHQAQRAGLLEHPAVWPGTTNLRLTVAGQRALCAIHPAAAELGTEARS